LIHSDGLRVSRVRDGSSVQTLESEAAVEIVHQMFESADYGEVRIEA